MGYIYLAISMLEEMKKGSKTVPRKSHDPSFKVIYTNIVLQYNDWCQGKFFSPRFRCHQLHFMRFHSKFPDMDNHNSFFPVQPSVSQ